jgi:hypothetical protein
MGVDQRFKYRMHEKERRLAIGVYPQVSLKEARYKREEAKRLVVDNIDSSKETKRKKLISKKKRR